MDNRLVASELMRRVSTTPIRPMVGVRTRSNITLRAGENVLVIKMFFSCNLASKVWLIKDSGNKNRKNEKICAYKIELSYEGNKNLNTNGTRSI